MLNPPFSMYCKYLLYVFIILVVKFGVLQKSEAYGTLFFHLSREIITGPTAVVAKY